MPISGVSQKLYQNYDFFDHLWSQAQTRRDDLLELTKRCVKIDNAFWLKLANSPKWVKFDTAADAKKHAKNTWLHGLLSNGQQITSELINTFFEGTETSHVVSNNKPVKVTTDVGSCPYVQGRMVIPYGPQYLTYQNMPYLNVAAPSVVTGDQQHLKIGLAVLLMIYRSLCNGPELDPNKDVESAMLLDQIVKNEFTQLEFRFVMNWLAAIVQRPGINLSTNLWIIGQQQGVGKGTLVDILKAVLGSDLVGALNQTEIEAGWNDHLFGKVLLEVNEFSPSGKMSAQEWDTWIKTKTCETELLINQRHTTAWTTLNIGNYLFTTNKETPIALDGSDRRNMIVRTTDDPFWKEYASQIKRNFAIPRMADLAKGFAWILEQVKVDFNLLTSAPMTQAKADIQVAYANPVEEWACDDPTIRRGEWVKAARCFELFRIWLGDNYPHKSFSSTAMGRELGNLVRRGLLQKKKTNEGFAYEFPVDMTKPEMISRSAEVCDAITAIVGAEIEVGDNDAPIILPDSPRPLTPAQRLREHLHREDMKRRGVATL